MPNIFYKWTKFIHAALATVSCTKGESDNIEDKYLISSKYSIIYYMIYKEFSVRNYKQFLRKQKKFPKKFLSKYLNLNYKQDHLIS